MIAVRYLLSTGFIVMQVKVPAPEAIGMYADDTHGAILAEAHVDPDFMYVVNGWLTPLPEKPEYPCYWDGLNWVQDDVVIERRVRRDRDSLLLESDWTDTVSAQTRLGPKYDEWQAYRQELRDITKQPGYPLDIQWPVKPE
jgi:hypothetical protein